MFLKNHILRSNFPYIVLTGVIFILCAFPFILPGMHEDGYIYSGIAVNINHHIGSLWKPSFNASLFPQFYEHPPLAFYLQSLFIKLFGENPWLDKLYFFILALGSLTMTLVFWRQQYPNITFYFIWIPILCWVTIHTNVAIAYNGQIESTLVIFTLLASYCILKGVCLPFYHSIYWYTLGALCITLAFYINGLQAFFPLVIPIIYSFVFEQKRKNLLCCLSRKSILSTSFLIVVTAGLIGLVLLYPPALNNTKHYFQEQVLATLSGARDGDHHPGFIGHFRIAGILAKNLIGTLGVSASLIYLYSKINNQNMLHIIKQAIKNDWCLFFLLLALSASLPTCISPRQAGRYIAPSCPFWALFFAQALTPICVQLVHTAKPVRIQKLIQRTVFFLSCIMIISVSYVFEHPSKRSLSARDALLLKTKIPPDTQISCDMNQTWCNWHMQTLLYRYHRTVLKSEANTKFHLQRKDDKNWPEGYEQIKADFKTIQLFSKNEVHNVDR